MGDVQAGGERFFPPREARTILDYVIDDFPFPLALTYSRLQQEMDRQEPIAAAWQLRDAFEAAIKFSASLAVADALASGDDADLAGQLAGILLVPQGLSLGHWHALLETALEPLKPIVKEGRPEDADRLLPELFGAFFEPTGRMRRNSVSRGIIGSDDSFVPWRNKVFGHGVFKEDRSWYADETSRMLGSLHALYEALHPVLDGWRMVSIAPGGEEIPWQGAQDLPWVNRHRHEPADDSMPIVLVERDGARRLPLTPFLSIQRCSVCSQPAAFFFDRQKKRDRTVLLEYARGHHHTRSGWSEIVSLQELVPPRFEWTRSSYDSIEIAGGDAIAFRDFEQEFTRPGYLLDAIWEVVDAESTGYAHLIGPEGTGKTWLVRGLADDAADHGATVLPYHIRPGALTDAITFLNELHLVASDVLPARTPAPQLLVSDLGELRAQFVSYLAELIQANNLETLVVAIDALDELGEPPAGAASITDLLPAPGELPEGCWFLLTSREALRPAVRAGLERLAGAMETIRLDPEAAGNRSLVRAYLVENLPAVFREPHHVDTVLDRSGGIFLYAGHLAHALESGAFATTDVLPDAEDFYPAYLARIRERVGERMFEDAYLQPLIFLTVAQQPVTLEQLVQWGVPRDRLQMALFDLRDFLHVQRVPGWHDSLNADGEARYALAHDAFGRYVREEPALSCRQVGAHIAICLQSLTRFQGRQNQLDPYDVGDLYILSHLLQHLQAAGSGEIVIESEALAKACYSAAGTAQQLARQAIAVRLLQQAITIRRALVNIGHTELASELAAALVNQGNALVDLGRLAEAVADYGEAIAIRRALVDRGRTELAYGLAVAVMERGNALDNLGRPIEAVADYDEAITLCRSLVAGGRGDLANELAMALLNRGICFRRLGRLNEAIADYDEGIEIYRALVDGGLSELVNDLAMALMSRGNALADLGRLAEAVAAHDEAIALRRALLDGGRTELANDLARALVNRGNALLNLRRLGEAVAAYDEAIVILRALVAGGRGELANELATALVNRGIALWQLGRLAEAVAAYDEAIAIRRALVAEGRAELGKDLATALMNRGIALTRLGRLTEAEAAYDEAIAIRRELVAGGRAELGKDLAQALMNRGIAAAALGRLTEAVAAYDEAIAMYREPVAGGRAELANSLAAALVNRGNALDDLGRLTEAMENYDEAIGIRRLLVNAGRAELADGLAKALEDRGLALDRSAQLAEAAAAYDEAIAILRELVDSGRAELVDDLVRALLKRATLFKKSDRIDDALTCYQEAIDLRERAYESSTRYLLPNLLQTIRYRAMTLRSLERWSELAGDVVRVLDHARSALNEAAPDDRVATEERAMLDMVRELQDVNRETVLGSLGPWETWVRSNVNEGQS